MARSPVLQAGQGRARELKREGGVFHSLLKLLASQAGGRAWGQQAQGNMARLCLT